METHLKKESLQKSDEAWLIVDKDQWTTEQLSTLHKWSQKEKNYGFALSNPKFELWLLLHFEDGNNITSPQNCSERLKKYLPDYNKGIDIRKFDRKMIESAIARAKQKDSPTCNDWPRNTGTTVYRLIENIFSSQL